MFYVGSLAKVGLDLQIMEWFVKLHFPLNLLYTKSISIGREKEPGTMNPNLFQHVKSTNLYKLLKFI